MCPHAWFTHLHLLVDVGQVAVLRLFLGFCKKKVKALAKQKDCELVGEWEQSMINYMYWCMVFTPSGNGNMMVAVWLLLENHVYNKHSGHGKLFQKCSHGRLVGRNRNKK